MNRTAPNTTTETPTPDAAAREFADRTFRYQFLPRLNALAGLLNAIDASGSESTPSVFIAPTLNYVSELASDLALEYAARVRTHQAQDDQEGGVA